MEIKLSQEDMKYKKQELGYTQGLAVSSISQSGDLALLWKPKTKVAIQGFSRWHIDAYITCASTGVTWRLIGFYGQPDTNKREETWSILESLGRTNQLPWLCIGDFNEILSHSEKSDGRLRPARQLDRFHGAIDLCGFHDLGFVGSPFIWPKTDRLEGSLRIRLDRALADNAWRLIFTSAVVHHIPMSTLDHYMLSLHLQDDHHNRRKNKRLFRFEEMWLRDPRCFEVVQEAWQEGLYKPDGFPITNCLETCRDRLQHLNKTEYGHVGQKIQNLQK